MDKAKVAWLEKKLDSIKKDIVEFTEVKERYEQKIEVAKEELDGFQTDLVDELMKEEK